MFRYGYNQQVQPPAPYVLVNLSDYSTVQTVSDLPGLVDSGADQTVIAKELADRLQLPQYDIQRIEGFAGQSMTLPEYLVQLAIRDLPPVAVQVLAFPGLKHIVLGRDVLNRYYITLDGPNLALEIR